MAGSVGQAVKGWVIFKSGYPVGVFFKGYEFFSEKFKGYEIIPGNCKGYEIIPGNCKGYEIFPKFSENENKK